MAFMCEKWRHHEYIDTVITGATLNQVKMMCDSARLAKARASIYPSQASIIVFCRTNSLCSFVDESLYRFVLPHNFDQFFIHDCFELHDDNNFQEYPG